MFLICPDKNPIQWSNERALHHALKTVDFIHECLPTWKLETFKNHARDVQQLPKHVSKYQILWKRLSNSVPQFPCLIFRKTDISDPLIRTRMYAFHGARNVNFSEKILSPYFESSSIFEKRFFMFVEQVINFAFTRS